jgi:hypothetical protein
MKCRLGCLLRARTGAQGESSRYGKATLTMVLWLQDGGNALLQIAGSPRVGDFTSLEATMRSMQAEMPFAPVPHSAWPWQGL